MRYNFVICPDAYDYNRILFSDLLNREDVIYTDGPGAPHSLCRLLHKVHTSPKFSSLLFNLPGKQIWHKHYFHNKFRDDKPICFVFYASYLLSRYDYPSYLNYLRKTYPSSKLVIYYEDRVESFSNRVFPDNDLKGRFDLLVSYDKVEAAQYGMRYYPTTASKIDVPPCCKIARSDVYLLAYAKDRLPKYKAIYGYLKSNGIVCDFNILGVEPKFRDSSGIHYLNRPMGYLKNLQHVAKTKCILDIQQYNSVGYTLRLWEAVLYDKKLLTDNAALESSGIYDRSYISIIRDGRPDLDFIRDNKSPVNPHKEEISPEGLLHFIEGEL